MQEGEQQQWHHPHNKVDRAAFILKHQCSSLSSLKQVHAHLARHHLLHNSSLTSSLSSLYSSAYRPDLSLVLFSALPHDSLSVSLFNRSIRSLSKSPLPHLSFHLLLLLLRHPHRLRPNHFTLPPLLSSAPLPLGSQLHSLSLKTSLLSFLPVSNALVHMYSACSSLLLSRRAFDDIPFKDTVSFNALLGAHARLALHAPAAHALLLRMPSPNTISWNAVLVAYANSADLPSARNLFDTMPQRSPASWTAMIVAYARLGLLPDARALFDSMPPHPNLVAHTVMINGYAQNGQPDEALSIFRRMESACLKPDAVAMVGVISAAAQLGCPDLARFLSSYVERAGIERNRKVLTALLDMHAKCGNLEEACRVFDEIPWPDAYAYTALITGLASYGLGTKALEVFRRMLVDDVKPDYITYIGVLSACSHTGLVDDGLRFWRSMIEDYRIEPGPDHYACMVDVLGRAGRLEEAERLLDSMPNGPHCIALGALLAACRTYGNVEIAEHAAAQLFELEPENTGNYMLLASIYSLKERWDDATRVRRAMNEKGINKLRGCSWVETERASI